VEHAAWRVAHASHSAPRRMFASGCIVRCWAMAYGCLHDCVSGVWCARGSIWQCDAWQIQTSCCLLARSLPVIDCSTRRLPQPLYPCARPCCPAVPLWLDSTPVGAGRHRRWDPWSPLAPPKCRHRAAGGGAVSRPPQCGQRGRGIRPRLWALRLDAVAATPARTGSLWSRARALSASRPPRCRQSVLLPLPGWQGRRGTTARTGHLWR